MRRCRPVKPTLPVRHRDPKRTPSHRRTRVYGRIRIPINEPADPKSQVQEYLSAYHGEGIQHIALATGDIHTTVEQLRRNAVRFMDVPDSYYDAVERRIPGHGQDLERLRENRILIDGSGARALLLQIFTETVIPG